MNNKSHLFKICILLTLTILLNGCFGGGASVPRSETQMKADSALLRGVRAEQKGNYADAVAYFSESLTVSTSIEDMEVRTTALLNLARLYRLQRDLPHSEPYLEQALALTETYPALRSEIYQEKALLELSKGQLANAQTWSEMSIAAESGNQRGSRLNLAARIHLELGNPEKTLIMSRQALHENRSAKLLEEEANSLRIMGISARLLGSPAESENYLQEALAIDKRIGISSKIAADLEELGSTSLSAGNLKQAASALERASEIHTASGRRKSAALNQTTLANIYSRLGDLIKAEKAITAARDLEAERPTPSSQNSSVTINPSSKP